MRPRVLMLSPEPPYPLHGGGAFRIASLLGCFARFSDIDLILISEDGQPASLPAGLVRSQHVISLPVHSRAVSARYFRNARRAVRGTPPLIDRLAGLEQLIEAAIEGRSWNLGVIEHFWCAPYVKQLTGCCTHIALDLHNIESVLHERCASLPGSAANAAIRAGHRRFASASRRLESELFPHFSVVLAASDKDAATVSNIAPQSHVIVFPNAIPWVETPNIAEESCVVFSANFEYHPNIDAVQFLTREIWPEVRRLHPELELRLIGRGDRFIRHLLDRGSGIYATGPVEDAFTEIARGSIVLAPLRAGSGTRIKILEAWAAARAVVATPLAAEGLDAHDGSNIALASDAPAFIAAIDRLLRDSAARLRLASGGRRSFESGYSWEAAWNCLKFDSQLMLYSALTRYTEKS